MVEAFLWGLASAASLLVGAAVYWVLRPGHRVLGLVMGFGAGVLISAVSFELAAEAFELDERKGTAALGLALGALTFFVGDAFIDRAGGADRKSILPHELTGTGGALVLGSLLDGVPESFVLGISLASGDAVAVALLAAVVISNLPEGVAATAALQARGSSRWAVVGVWLTVMLAAAASAALGYAAADGLGNPGLAFVNGFAAGAILTMVVDTMVPEAVRGAGRYAGLVATLGFGLSLLLTYAGG